MTITAPMATLHPTIPIDRLTQVYNIVRGVSCDDPDGRYVPVEVREHFEHEVPALIAENARLRAIVDQVQALAADASPLWSEAPVDGTLVVVATSGGWQDQPEIEHTYVRSDRDAQQLKDAGLTSEWADGAWWPVGSGKPTGDEYPRTWGELNWLDDPACDRGSVSIETFVSTDTLQAVLAVRDPAEVPA